VNRTPPAGRLGRVAAKVGMLKHVFKQRLVYDSFAAVAPLRSYVFLPSVIIVISASSIILPGPVSKAMCRWVANRRADTLRWRCADILNRGD